MTVVVNECAATRGASPAAIRMAALHAHHAPSLYRFLLRLTLGEPYLAEDLLQETMLRAWRNIEDVPHGYEPERRWLFTAARRIAIDAARARQARPTETGATDLVRLPEADDAIERLVIIHTMREALPKVSDAHRQVLIEMYYFGRSSAEAAQRLGIPEGTVRSRAHYALRALRAALGLDG
ncbi:sigma-70 family RNA polymerase sigma factor [Acrocarpospora catenulata]|uniref:sigma-70 family RNA polymerase sigma factor n=1 Tax=Acrocarpospora catenulata TaxID=2836182 RepID=UPI0027DEDE18|nr:sigma-70 family RNA polymerase sigma factor [Acrocarpospora catenulata]